MGSRPITVLVDQEGPCSRRAGRQRWKPAREGDDPMAFARLNRAARGAPDAVPPGRSGFTLIELLVVIVVIAVLAAIIIPRFADHGLRSKEASLRSNLSLLRSAVSSFQADTQAYPAALDDVAANSAPAKGIALDGSSTAINALDWHGPYLQGAIPVDPISGSPFGYSIAAGT